MGFKEIISDFDSYMSLLSSFIALIAVLIALSSKKIAKQAKNIAESEYQSKMSSIKLNINDSYRLRSEHDYLCFNVTITSLSYIEDGISSIELQLKYSDKDGNIYECILPPEEQPSLDREMLTEVNILDLNISLKSRQSVSGYIFFSLPRRIADYAKIDSSKIVVNNSKGVACFATSFVLRSFENVR